LYLEIVRIDSYHVAIIAKWLASDRKSKQRWEDVARFLELSPDDVSDVISAFPDNIELQIEATLNKLREQRNLAFNCLYGALGIEGCHDAASKFYRKATKHIFTISKKSCSQKTATSYLVSVYFIQN